MNDWRKEVEVTFPIVRYHPLVEYGDGVKIRKTRVLLDSPRSTSGSPDGSDYLRHGGTGLSRSADYPSKEAIIPGGILDSTGQHIPIIDIDAPEKTKRGITGFFLAWFADIRTYKHRYSFGEPEQLNLEEFKDRIIKLGEEERKMPRPTEKIRAAKSFYEVMEAECEPDITAAYHKTVRVKNWLDHAG